MKETLLIEENRDFGHDGVVTEDNNVSSKESNMKVLKKGCDNPNFGKEAVCRGRGVGKGSGGCGALLHVVPRDIHKHTDCDGDTDYWFVCPDCHANTYVRYDFF